MLTAASRIHPALQNQNCSHLVDNFASPFDRHFSFSQQTVGLGRAQSFVPKMHGQREALAQFLGETLHLLCLDTFGSIHLQGIAHHDLGNLVIADYLLELPEVQAFVLPLNGFESLCGNAKQVRNRYPNPL